jgi:hypothetical protein
LPGSRTPLEAQVRNRKRAGGTGTVSSLCVYSALGDPVGCRER